ncbi:phage head morphogenesis protein [Parabacteroides distasonis]|uniref:Phage head morphogenesis protein n=1 Tax=Parabacteroides distasonis TaxID=823 RepID=A0A4S2EGY4_PARDI|nr:phage minor head protein [Parabacteroides distasonis]TGY55158.1 phage head morphogenesis protein [Parabacteroides distasonis]
MGLYGRAAEVYKGGGLVLSAKDYPDISGVEAAFDKAIEWLHDKRVFGAAMLRDDAIAGLIEETASFLSKGIERGLGESSPSEAMVNSLRESVGVFSGFKTFHEMKEAAGMLLDESGNIKPFEQYYKDVQTLNDTYNKFYLKTEYDFTVASSEMAARWEEQRDDGGGRYLLQYRTVGDNKVRKEHRTLEGITLPSSDPFWDSYYPPNGWRCRCTVTKVRAAKYPATDSKEAMTAGEKATEGKYAEMFRFNPGKQRAAYPAYNTYTISKCSVCKKGNVKLGKIPSNELCAACPIIRECAGDMAKSQTAIERKHYLREMQPLLKKKVTLEIDGVQKSIGFRKEGNEHLYSDTFGRSSVLKKGHLSELDKVLEKAVYVRTSDSLSHERKDKIKRFYYLKSEIEGKTVYLNVAETDEKSKKGVIWHNRFLYSITDKIK